MAAVPRPEMTVCASTERWRQVHVELRELIKASKAQEINQKVRSFIIYLDFPFIFGIFSHFWEEFIFLDRHFKRIFLDTRGAPSFRPKRGVPSRLESRHLLLDESFSINAISSSAGWRSPRGAHMLPHNLHFFALKFAV